MANGADGGRLCMYLVLTVSRAGHSSNIQAFEDMRVN